MKKKEIKYIVDSASSQNGINRTRFIFLLERTKKLEKNKMTILQDIGHQAMKEDDLWDTGERMRSIVRQWKLVSLLPGESS